MESVNFSAIFIGEQSILLSCAEVWLQAGNTVSTVVTDNTDIQAWCRTQNIEFLSWNGETLATLLTRRCDYLFSLANLRILSDDTLGIAKVASINFHDGPLPGYTGVNTPSWAIINGEQNHAISFHRMTPKADCGEVLLQKSFELDAESTSLTANATAFELALSMFEELVKNPPDAIADNEITPHTRTKNHYCKSDRPSAAGILDFEQSSEQIDRTIRALDFGQYKNPLTKPKLWNGHSLLYVGQAEIKDINTAVGSVTNITNNSISIGSSSGSVTLSNLTTPDGNDVSEILLQQYVQACNNQIPLCKLSLEDQALLDNAAKHEEWWVEALSDVTPLHAPYFQENEFPPESSNYDAVQYTSTHDKSKDHILAVSAAYLSRITQQSTLDLGWFTPVASNNLLKELIQDTVPLRINVEDSNTIERLTQHINTSVIATRLKGHFLKDLNARQNLQKPKFNVTFSFEDIDPTNLFNSDLHFSISEAGNSVTLYFNRETGSEEIVSRISSQLFSLLDSTDTKTPVSDLDLLTPDESKRLHNIWNAASINYECTPIHHLIERSVADHPADKALVFESRSISYQELNERSNQLAHTLISKGLRPQQKAGVLMERSIDMVVTLLAVLKCGAAYVPLDPTYPANRLNHMVEDAGLSCIVCDEHLKSFLKTGNIFLHVISSDDFSPTITATNPNLTVAAEDLAYVIYTSGSTGLPKGVMVEHRNVANFFAAMDEKIKPPYDTWLAVTSISFDISVLEIFWTLARGFKVVLHSDDRRQKTNLQTSSQHPDKSIDLSLFYWNVAEEDSIERQDKYRLLLEGAKFADENGFAAVWNPERHFAAFGGSFPNPAVTCAAIAATTKNIDIRAGSCVAPLHSPIRIAEDWAVVDNLSNGRAGVAFASGWAPPDFAILPDNFEHSKTIMFEHMEKVQRLWRGENLDFDGPKGKVSVRTLPRPIQKELPVWITTAGNIDSYISAGKLGANILTHLLGQTLAEVNEKAAAYHEAWQAAGHAGKGKITLMLHTFVGEDKESVKAIVHQPMKRYLKSAMFLVKAAAWNFPTFKKLSAESGTSIDGFFESLSEEDLDALLDFAFDRYFETSGLFGSVSDAASMIDQCKAHSIDEVACLIDYGVDDQQVLDHLPYLAELREQACVAKVQHDSNEYSIADQILHHNVSHLQCTPSMASLLLADDSTKDALKSINHMLVGGEALPAPLAKELVEIVKGSVTNMYGPTETTIWSSTSELSSAGTITIGSAIANTQIYIVDKQARLLPHGIPGELVIAGDGVVRGYHNNQILTDERFIPDTFTGKSDARMYRTGDLAMYAEDGAIVYLGRLDHQVKLHGYRIELGEIESALGNINKVSQAAVVVREDAPNDRRIVAYLVTDNHHDQLATEVIRENLKENLPTFMVPTVFVQLDSLPLTPNGKIDRNALPRPENKSSSQRRKIVAPKSDIEITIAECWKNSLGVSDIGRDDNFFDIGGNSILLLDVLARLNKQEAISRTLRVTDVFRYSTVETLADFLSQEAKGDAGTSAENSNVKPARTGRAKSRRAAMQRRRRSDNRQNEQTLP